MRWVDVTTGRTGSASFGYSASQQPGVGRTALSPDGRTLFVQVWYEIENGGGGTATTWVVDTRSGDVRRLCPRCDTDVAWDAAGRPLLREGVTLPGATTGVLPAGGPFSALEQDSPASPRTFVSPDGTRRLVVAGEDGKGSDAAGPMRLVEVDAKGAAVRTTNLGSAWDARLLAWRGDTAWVSVHPENDDRYVVRRVTLGTDRSEEVLGWGSPEALPVDEGSGVAAYRVVALADDVVAGGRTVDTPPPSPAPWWSVEALHLRLAGMLWTPLVVPLAGLLVVGLVLVRRVVRRSAR